MPMTVRDTIERQMTFELPREVVWEAITDAEQLGRWFGTHAELDLRPGGEGFFTWEHLDVTTRVTVEAVEPPARFAYRWEPSGSNDGGPTTLVEFRLDEIPGGTRLTLVESGFAQFAPASWQGNEFGWDVELGELRAFLLEKAAA
jgi:uncharacterized protein YndB with AHSA1/START domain